MATFADLVLEHLSVEERVLFPMAQSLLTAEENEAAARKWAKRRGVHLGG